MTLNELKNGGWQIASQYDQQLVFYRQSRRSTLAAPLEAPPRAALLLSGGAPLVLTEWYPLPTPEFKFVPSAKKAVIRLAIVPSDYRLRGLSSRRPVSVIAEGATLEWSHNPDTYALEIKVPAGRAATVEVTYEQIAPNRFMPLPIPSIEPRRVVQNFGQGIARSNADLKKSNAGSR